ncbi:MAG TPA: ATP-binding protein [Polyangia bacterium]|nr:ATP-binding protein [Polyangia bacterium]
MNDRQGGTSGHQVGDDTFLAGAGEMGALVRSTDWGATPFGPLTDWPQSLRTTMSICLNSRFPIAVYWGPEYLMLYNQSLVPMVGPKKHPGALGQPAGIVLAEIWGIIEPLLSRVRMTGEATWSEDLMLPLARTGLPEESYFTFTYSPIRDETGGVGGVFCAVVETTDKVIEERRLRLLNALAEAARAPTPADACAHAAAEIARAPADLPFALLYLLDEAGVATLVGAANVRAGTPLAPTTIPPGGGSRWPLAEVKHEPCLVPLADGPGGARGAVILPIEQSGGGQRYGFVVAGLSPLLAQSTSYTRFQTLLAASVSQAVGSAAAYEEERQRAAALEELDRAKTAFFSNVSHEFRTPLTLMLGPAEDALAGAELLAPADRQRWELVHRSALRLSKLVNALLDFSRIEAGRVEASYEPTDLSALTGELASMFRSAIDRGGLKLRLDLGTVDELAYVDREMWEKIVLNLLSNALKFTFEGEIAVALRLQGSDFELVVRDTGIGIAAAELPHVFDRFHRIKGARARTQEGTGIGLALVAELVKLHGGKVRVESAEGQGTTFSIRLPRGDRHLPSDRIGAARALPSTSSGVAPYLAEALRWTSATDVNMSRVAVGAAPAETGRRARILLADDNADMRDYLTRLLRERWDVEAVTDGEAALAAVKRERPDLVLTDVMMPGLDGFGLLRAIRGDADLCLLPVILLSARAGEEATAEGLGAGANDYVVKPFLARDLLVRIGSKLAVAEVAREARAIEEAARKRLYGHFMQAPFPIAVLRGPDHIIELANPRALKGWGKTESIVGKPLVEGMPELEGQPFLGYLDGVFRTGVAYEARGELARLSRSSDGNLEDVYWDLVYAPLRAGDGAVDGILVTGFEVTAQVLAAKETGRLLASVAASERQFRELVENLPLLAWTARPDGFIDYYNRRWYEYTGTTFEENQGWGWKSLHDPTKLDAVVERWQHSIATGEPFEMEFPLRGADGVFHWFLTRVEPLHDAEGRLVRWFGSNTNIDDRRRSDDFREMFLGILGHDLRNPLHTVLTTAHVLSKRPDTPPEVRKRLLRVTSSGIRMQRMIDQLLDLTRARLADGIPVTLSAEAVDLAPLVIKIVDEVRTARPATSIKVRVEGSCAARIDPDRFEQVVSNLVGNAVAHGDTTQPINVVLTSSPQAVIMTVQNGGPPIAPELMPLLFNPFARDEKLRGLSTGLGLGLYISERIVHAHRGQLSVHSSQAEGTRVEVVLPK